jgi:hypothetical protein
VWPAFPFIWEMWDQYFYFAVFLGGAPLKVPMLERALTRLAGRRVGLLVLLPKRITRRHIAAVESCLKPLHAIG